MTVWDVGGQDRIRALWRHYYQNTDAVIFVVDSSDVERLDEAASELSKVLGEPELAAARLLVLANKQDLPTAQSSELICVRTQNDEESRVISCHCVEQTWSFATAQSRVVCAAVLCGHWRWSARRLRLACIGIVEEVNEPFT